MTMDFLGLALALFIFVNALDRLRRVTWRTARPEAVLQLLFQALWALFCLYLALAVGLKTWQFAGLLAILVWLHITRPAWRDEKVPPSVLGDRGDLGATEFQHSKGRQ